MKCLLNILLVFLLVVVTSSSNARMLIGSGAVGAAGSASDPCTDCTTDGDGSTALVLCEQTNETNALECTYDASSANFTIVDPATGYPCGNDKVISFDGANGTHRFDSTQTESQFMFWIYPKSSGHSNIVDIIRLDCTSTAVCMVVKWDDTPNTFKIYWEDSGSTQRTVSFTCDGQVDDNWCRMRVWYKKNSDPGIRLWVKDGDLAETEIDLTGTTDSTLNEDIIELYMYSDSDGDYEMGAMKWRSGATSPPETCE